MWYRLFLQTARTLFQIRDALCWSMCVNGDHHHIHVGQFDLDFIQAVSFGLSPNGKKTIEIKSMSWLSASFYFESLLLFVRQLPASEENSEIKVENKDVHI